MLHGGRWQQVVLILCISLHVAKGAPKEKGGADCAMDMDCQLNGRCTGGKCVCNAAWTGHNCSFLDVLPSKDAAFREENTSSWGGRSYFANGEYHAFFSEFGGTCGMNLWANHSRVVHAVASEANPKGGYKRVGVAIPAFSHCVDPVLIRSGPHNGTWLLFHNGDGMPRDCGGGSPDCPQKPIEWLAHCNNDIGDGTTPEDQKITARPRSPEFDKIEPSNGVHQSDSPNGPWTKPSAAALVGVPMCDCPAVHALSNGSIIMWCQPLVNFPPGAAAHVSPIYINEGWGTSFVKKPATIDIPAWLTEAAQKTKHNEGVLVCWCVGVLVCWYRPPPSA
jgi:hypothetical protein